MAKSRLTDDERFEAKIERHDDGCWYWVASKNRDGYGGFAPGGGRGPVLAHRWSYQRFVGPIPPGKNVLHTCDQPSCVNPAHLFTGDQHANVMDAVNKGRWGTRGTFRKLSPAIHETIRARYREGDVSQAAIAKEFGVSQANIHHIVSRDPAYIPMASRQDRGRRRAELSTK
jgi:hypothetical protein